MGKFHLTGGQKAFLVLFFLAAAIIGFMIKLPSAFRHIDKELHAVFYFMAAAFLNILFADAKVVRHLVIFAALFLFGTLIEYAQGYSNRFFRRPIHGRFDPEDIQWNLIGLISFSVLWFLSTALFSLRGKATVRSK